MADVTIRVTGQDVSGTAVLDDAADGLERIGDEARKATPKLTGLEAAERGAAAGADKMGDQFDQSKRDAEQLQKKLLELKATTVTLGKQFAETGGTDMNILKEFTKATTELNKTRRVAKTLDIDDPTLINTGKKAAGTFASAFQGGIMATMQALPNEAKIVIAGTAGAIGLTLGVGIIAALNSVLLAGAGFGGLVAGIKLAAKDPEVSGAFSDLGSTISDRLDRSVQPFKGELVESADIFEKAFQNVAPQIDTIFAGLSQEIKPLAEGLAKGFENAIPGIRRGLAAAQPLIRDFANELPRIGKLIGGVFDALADAGPGLQLVFRDVLLFVELLIKDFEFLIDVVKPIPNAMAAIGTALGLWDISAPKSVAFTLSDMKDGAEGSSESFENLTSQMYNTADAAKELDDRFRSLFDVMMTQDEANLKVKQGWIDLTKELKDGKRTLDENTQAGLDNSEAILDQIKNLDAQREATIAAGNGTKEATETANRAYAGQIETLRRTLLQLGFNIAEVDRLINKYYQIPSEINTNINTNHYDFYYSRSGGAFDPGSREERRYGKVFGGIIGAAATGGIHNGMTKVGEGGWEYARLPVGTMVYSHANSSQMDAMSGQQGGDAGGSISVALVSDARGGDVLTEVISELIRKNRLKLKVVNNRVVPA